MDILTLSASTILAIPVVVALSSLVRMVGLPVRYSPLADVVFGIGIVFLIGGVAWQGELLQGLLVALSAAGLYSAPQVVAGSLVSSESQPNPYPGYSYDNEYDK